MELYHNLTYEEISGFYLNYIGQAFLIGYDAESKATTGDYKDLQKAIREKLQKHTTPRSVLQTKITIKNGVAGCGKTVSCIENFNILSDVYITNTVESLNDFRTKLTAYHKKHYGVAKLESIPAKTFEVGLLVDFHKYRRVWIDEIFTFPINYLAVCMSLNPNAEYFLQGDVEQTPYLDKYGCLENKNASFGNYLNRFRKIEYNRYTRRFGRDVCSLLQTVENYYIWPHPENKRVTKITRSYENNKPQADLNLGFSRKCVDSLKEALIEAITVKVSQGKSKEIVNVYYGVHDHYPLQERSLRIVALSRAEKHLNLVEQDKPTLLSVIGSFEKIECINDQYFQMVAPENSFLTNKPEKIVDDGLKPHDIEQLQAGPFNKTVLEQILYLSDTIKVRDEDLILSEPKFNKFTGELEFQEIETKTNFPNSYLNFENHIESTFNTIPAPDHKRKIKMLEMNINKDKLVKTMSVTRAGKSFHVANNKQTLATSIKRTLRKRKIKKASTHLCNDIMKRFKYLYCKDDFDFEEPNQLLHKTLLELHRKMMVKPGFNQVDYELKPFDCFVREFLKDIQKIKGVEASLGDKKGQPIKGWMKEVNFAFCNYFRAVEQIIIAKLKPNIIYANNYSDEELNEKLNNQISSYDTVSGLDIGEFDASQNKTTQRLEKQFFNSIWKNMALDLYYKIRECVKCVSTTSTYLNKEVKTSGEPATLLANTVVSMILVANCLEVKNFKGAAFKGDDSWVFSVGDAWRKGLIIDHNKEIINVDLKVAQPVIPEFCGMLYYQDILFYNLPVLAAKILTRYYKDEEDLIQYQTAVKDKLKPYLKHADKINGVLSQLLNSTIDTAEQFVQQLINFTSVKWKDLQKDLIEINFLETVY